MIEALSTMSGIGGLIAFLVAVVFIPFCLSGDDSRSNEFGAMAWLTVLVFIVLIYPIGAAERLPVIAWLALIPTYFAIGALWFLYRWRQLILAKLAEARKDYDDDKPLQAHGAPRSFADHAKRFRPSAAGNKERIAGWILLWPWGMAWTVLKWPVRLAVHIAEWAHGIADRMVDRLWQA